MKKIISLVCVLALLLSSFCVGGMSFVSAETYFDEFEYTKHDDHIEITRWLTDSSWVTIPDEVDDLPVTAIGENAFAYKAFDYLRLPQHITYIGTGAFFDCIIHQLEYDGTLEDWEQIHFLENNEALMNAMVFHEDSFAFTVNINELTANICRYEGAVAVDSLIIPSNFDKYSVVSIGKEAFMGADIGQLTLPATIRSIEQGAFCCEIDRAFFEGTADEWMNVTVGDGNDTLKSAMVHTSDDFLYAFDNYHNGAVIKGYRGNSFVENLQIPEMIDGSPVVAIGDYAFANMHVETLTLPYTLSEIGHNAFSGAVIDCTYYDGPLDTWNQMYINSGNDALTASVVFRRDYYLFRLNDMGEAVIVGYEGDISTEYFSIPSDLDFRTVVSIDDNAFAGKRFTYVGIPYTVREIGDNAFADCTIKRAWYEGGTHGWMNVEVGEGNEALTRVMAHGYGDLLFSLDPDTGEATILGLNDNAWVYDLEIPDSIDGYPVTAIAESAFEYGGFNKLIIPTCITTIGDNAFNSCYLNCTMYDGTLDDWKSISVGSGNDTLLSSVTFGQDLFFFTVDFEANTATIVGYADNYPDYPESYYDVDHLVIPRSFDGYTVTAIGREAFRHIDIHRLVMPSTITTIGDDAFNNSSVYYFYFDGTEEEWQNVFRGVGNYVLEAAYVRQIGEFEYIYTYHGAVIIVGYKSNSFGDNFIDKLVIPTSINNGTYVTAIADDVFKGYEIDRLFLPVTLESIGDYAFDNCTINHVFFTGDIVVGNGTELTIGSGNQALTDVMNDRRHDYRFTVDPETDTATIVSYDGDERNLVIPSDFDGYAVERIGASAFAHCNFETVTLPTTVRYIGMGAFPYDCVKKAFYGDGTNTAFFEIYIEGGNEGLTNAIHFRSDGFLYSFDNSVYGAVIRGYEGNSNSIDTLTIPSTLDSYPVAAIGAYAFKDMTIGTLYLPRELQVVMDYAFASCEIDSAYYEGDSYEWGYIYVGCGNEMLHQSLLHEYCGVLYSVDPSTWIATIRGYDYMYLPFSLDLSQPLDYYTVGAIAEGAFDGLFLEKLYLPNTITYIGDNAFKNACVNGVYYLGTEDEWSRIEIGEGNEELFNARVYESEEGLLYKTYNGETTIVGSTDPYNHMLIIPSELGGYPVVSINYEAFAEHQNIAYLYIPDTITYIDSTAFPTSPFMGAFYGGSEEDFKELYIDSDSPLKYAMWNYDIASIHDGDEYFYGITTSDTVTLFYYYRNETDVYVPAEIDGYPVTTLGYRLFADSERLESITIPEGVTTIENSVFSWCHSLKTVVLPSTLTAIVDNMFDWCAALTTVVIPDSITSIGCSAFYRCESLTTIDLPESITSIGDMAFHDCNNLTHIVLPASVKEIGYRAFYDTPIETVYYGGSEEGKNDISIQYNPELDGVLWYYNVNSIGETDEFSYFVTNDDTVTIYDYKNSSLCYGFSVPSEIDDRPVTTLADYAFSSLDCLCDIWLPSSIAEIGDYVFAMNTLENVYFDGYEVDWKAITIGEGNEALQAATIHWRSVGDADGDGIISTSDARTVLKEGLKVDLTPVEVARLDFDCNGKVNSSDVRQMLKQVVANSEAA